MCTIKKLKFLYFNYFYLLFFNKFGSLMQWYSYQPNHDEVNFEFLENNVEKPIILQNYVFGGEIGEREEKLNLWFDSVG